MIKAYAAFEPGGALKPFEYDPGELQQHEVEIDVHYCGICHSDLSVLDDEWGMIQFPVVPGHEVVGTIAKAGTQVKHLAVGQSVGLGWHAGYCNTCSSCQAGDHNLCANSQPTIIGHHGGVAHFLLILGRSCSDTLITPPMYYNVIHIDFLAWRTSWEP